MTQYFEKCLGEIPSIKKNISEAYFYFKQEVADISAKLESGKHSNGVRLTKDDVVILQHQLTDCQKEVRKIEKEANSLIKTKEKYEKLLENLKKKG